MNTEKFYQPLPAAIEQRAHAKLSALFGGQVPELAKRELSEFLTRFPDVSFPNKDRFERDITADSVDLMIVRVAKDWPDKDGTTRTASPEITIGEYVQKLAKNYLNPKPKPGGGPTALQQKVWGMTEQQYADFLNDTSIPMADRKAVMEARNQKPDAEKQYQEKISDTSIPLEERTRIYREKNDLPDPKAEAAKQQARAEQMQSQDIATEQKIITWLNE